MIMDTFEKEILIQRTLWYISGSNDPRGLHKDDTLYKGKMINDKTADRVMEFMANNGHELKEEFKPSLISKIKGLQNQVGVSTGSIWRTYPSHKVNSLYDEIIVNKVGPDVIERMKALFRVEKIRIDNFREKYQEACERIIKEGKEMIMPDPETHRYVDTFPDNAEEYVKDRSKYIIDQFYNGLLLLKNNKPFTLIGYMPDFVMAEAIPSDLNIFFYRKPIEEDFISLMFSVDRNNNMLFVNTLRNTSSSRYKEFSYMLELIVSMVLWSLNIERALIDSKDIVFYKDYINTTLEPSIENLFKLQMKDFINE